MDKSGVRDMKLKLYPGKLTGTAVAPPSKSLAHRMLICAALADGETKIEGLTPSRDILATTACLEAFGARLAPDGRMTPIRTPPKMAVADCGESGSTLRFLLPVAAALGIETDFVLHGRLASRPLSPLWETLCEHGAELSWKAENVLHLSGRLCAGSYEIDGGVSSQFISGLLFALPLTGTGSLTVTGQTESADYVTLTLDTLSRFGIHWDHAVTGRYRSPGTVRVEGDWSNAAFWLAGGVPVAGLNPDSKQGDRAVAELAERIRGGSARIDGAQIPDIIPPLAVLAAVSGETTEFYRCGRLRLKESDRIESVCALLRGLGVAVSEEAEGFSVVGGKQPRGGTADSFGDHRIAMSAAILALYCREPVVLSGAEAVRKSYPEFWTEYRRLGGRAEEVTE